MRMVLCTCPPGESDRIARALVEERLVACVNVVPAVRSYYRWEGKLTTDGEALLIMKTQADRLPALVARIKEIHTYAVPEVIAFDVREGNQDYFDWVRRESQGA